MKLPDNPFDFIVPQSPDFRFSGWEYEFGKYQFFYVVGSRRLMAMARITDQSRAADEAALVNGSTPSSWVSAFPGFDWETGLAKNQVRRALRHEPQQFLKACQSVIAVMNAVENHGKKEKGGFLDQNKDTPLSDFLMIKPATFDIPEFHLSHVDSLSSKDKESVLAKGRQRQQKLLSQIAVSRGATYPTLRDMAACLSSMSSFGKSATVEPMMKRTYGAQVCKDEIVDDAT